MTYAPEVALAVWKRRCGGALIVINDFDHPPPHCHIFQDRRHMKGELWSLHVIKPEGEVLTPAVRRCLKRFQLDMLEAWERVRVYPETER